MQESLIEQIIAARQAAATESGTAEPAPVRRLSQLLDADSFIEYGQLAGETTRPDDNVTSDALTGGVGLIQGKPVVVASYDTHHRDGTQTDRNQRKMAKLGYLAVEHRWPIVIFVDGAGARATDPLPPPPIAVTPRGRFDLFDALAEMNGWAPTVAILHGTALDGHAGIAMLADLVIATTDSRFGSQTGVTRGAADYAKSGDIDVMATDEPDAIDAARRYLGYYLQDQTDSFTPDAGARDIADIIPDNRRRPYDMRKVIQAFADEASVLEIGRDWGRSMLTAFARLEGRTIGIYANQPKSPLAGAIDAAAADKASRFIELCDAYEYPIVTFIDNPGYMVGPQSEQQGIARHHARPLVALQHRTVPLYSVQIRKAYGLGPYAMSGWGSARRMPELRLAWPSVESGGMSLEGAAALVKRKEIRAATSKAEALAIRDEYAEKMRDAASGLRAGRSYQFDDIVLPTETRGRIASLLHRVPRVPATRKKHAIDPR